MDTEITNGIKNGKNEVWSKKQTGEKRSKTAILGCLVAGERMDEYAIGSEKY